MQLQTRRSFLKRTAIIAGALSVPRSFRIPGLMAANPASRKLNCVQIGCGIRGVSTHLPWVVEQTKDNLLAIVDPDESRHALVRKWLQEHGQDPGKLKFFTDYRVMFDKLWKEIDAVFIATPNHQHAAPAMLALEHGKA